MSAETVPARVRRRVRVGWWVALAVGAVIVVVGVAQMFTLPRTADVAVPHADATAEEVVRAYLKAIDVHDCDTAQDLTAPSFAAVTESMCHDAASLTTTGLETVGTGAVHASFDLDRRMLAQDVTIPEDGWGWTYSLTRGPEGWRISDAGNG
jgi:hypothetical protein